MEFWESSDGQVATSDEEIVYFNEEVISNGKEPQEVT
jgi:hypothetical protein